MNDIEIEDAPGPTDEQLRQVAACVRTQVMLEKEVAQIEDDLARAKEQLKQVSETDLPNAMSMAGVEEFTLSGNIKYRVRITQIVRATIPKPEQERAFAWLEEHGHGSIIKRDIKVQLGRGEKELAKKLLTWLAENARQAKTTDNPHVHPQTLGAFVREQLATIPHDLFGVYVQKFAKIEAPKEVEVVE